MAHAVGQAWPDAEVTLVEAMGAHEVVWMDMQGQRLAAIVPATGRHQIGDKQGVQMDLDRATVFDPVTRSD